MKKNSDYKSLEIQLDNYTYDRELKIKENENLNLENKKLSEEIFTLKRTFNKIDDWKNNLFDILKKEKLDNELFKRFYSEFPYLAEKENLESIKNLNYKQNLENNSINREYLLSSFNSHRGNNDKLNKLAYDNEKINSKYNKTLNNHDFTSLRENKVEELKFKSKNIEKENYISHRTIVEENYNQIIKNRKNLEYEKDTDEEEEEIKRFIYENNMRR